MILRPSQIAGVAALFAATALLIVAIGYDLLPWLRGPAPFPDEWRWEYAPKPTATRGGLALLCALGLCGLMILSGTRWAKRSARRLVPVLLIAGAVLGWGLQIGLLNLEEGGAVQSLLDRTLDPVFNSYYAVAASPMAADVPAFLDRHAELLPRLREAAPHAATHPPGPILYYRGLIAVCESWPALSDRLHQAIVRTGVDLSRVQPPLPENRLAAALLGASLLGLLCAATCWPTASLAESLGASPLAAARVGLLWNLLPGPALMTPEVDQALALPVTASIAILAGLTVCGRRSGNAAMRGAAAGSLVGIALLVSYGAAVFVLIGVVAVLASASSRRPPGSVVAVTLGAAGLVAVGVVALPVVGGHDVLAAARTALAIHREVYTAPRDYATWLFFNPLDLAVFLGLPVVLLGVARAVKAAFSPISRKAVASAAPRLSVLGLGRFHAGIAGGLFLLLLSGVVRGEIGRICLPLMPLLLVAALLGEDRDRQAADPVGGARTTAAKGPSAALAVLLAVLLAGLCFAVRLSWQVP